ncbi:MAG: asparagine synthetase B [Clostridia bacterium]|nr:asparagine synthetase B [Clostridia bacterium]
MAQFLGMYHSNKPRALQGYYDAPYVMMGRNVLCGQGHAAGDGVCALISGWIRNADTLRAEIRAAGRAVSTDSRPAALLMSAYLLWGDRAAEKIEGPAVLVVIDQNRDRLMIASDRMGEAGPVFWADKGGFIAFSDHPAPLLELSEVSRAVNADGWREVFALGPARTPGTTPFKDVRALPPGHILTADGDGVSVRRYFSLAAAPHEDDEKATVERVRALAGQAVRDAARFNPVSMLSGGLDSTVLTALLARHAHLPVRTFSVDYEGNDRHFSGGSYQPEQDAPFVEKAVRFIGTSHTRVVLSIESLISALDGAAAARGFPGMADVDSSLLLFSRRIAGEAKHVVSGECGDEVFGGYPWFHREELLARDGFPWSGSLQLRESILTEDARRALRLSEYAADRWRDSLARQPRLSGESAQSARLRALQGVCFEYFMANLQERAAAMGAAAGLTVLTPYCDDRLVQYVYNVPWEMKSMGGQEKGLLRAAMQGLLPDDLLYRKKSPYPKTYHPLYAKLATGVLRDILSDSGSPILQLVDREAVLRLMDGDLSPSATPWFGQLMSGPQMLAYLIQINQWMLRSRVEVAL